jgi:hypothetical protein
MKAKTTVSNRKAEKIADALLKKVYAGWTRVNLLPEGLPRYDELRAAIVSLARKRG